MSSPSTSGNDTVESWQERVWNSSPVVTTLDEHVRVRLVKGHLILEQDDASSTVERSASDEHTERG
jgi:hypothetical protein